MTSRHQVSLQWSSSDDEICEENFCDDNEDDIFDITGKNAEVCILCGEVETNELCG